MLGSGDLPPDLAPLAGMRDRLQQCNNPQLARLPREALVGSLALSLEQKQASVDRLCDRTTAEAELEGLLPRLEQEYRRLRRLGLSDGDIELLFAQRASGRLPLPLLTPAEVEAAVRVTGLKTLRHLAWRLLCSPKLVKIRDARTAADWVAWGLGHAGQAGSREWANAAGTLRRNRQFAAARQTLEQADRRGESARAWYEHGILLTESGDDLVSAEAAFRSAIALDQSDAWPWNGLGILLTDKLARYEEAETAYREAIALDPSDAGPWNNLGILLADKLARDEEAEAAYRQAITLDPSDAYPWTNMGRLLEGQGRMDEAEIAYAKGAELDAENVYPRRKLLELRARRSLTTAQDALKEGDWPLVRETLNQLPTDSVELASWLASPALVEGLVGQALASGQGASMLDLFRELNFDRQVRPLLLALEARLLGTEETFADSEPETRSAARLLFIRAEAVCAPRRSPLCRVAPASLSKCVDRSWRQSVARTGCCRARSRRSYTREDLDKTAASSPSRRGGAPTDQQGSQKEELVSHPFRRLRITTDLGMISPLDNFQRGMGHALQLVAYHGSSPWDVRAGLALAGRQASFLRRP